MPRRGTAQLPRSTQETVSMTKITSGKMIVLTTSGILGWRVTRVKGYGHRGGNHWCKCLPRYLRYSERRRGWQGGCLRNAPIDAKNLTVDYMREVAFGLGANYQLLSKRKEAFVCNAFNHPDGCNCGFGGNTSGADLKELSAPPVDIAGGTVQLKPVTARQLRANLKRTFQEHYQLLDEIAARKKSLANMKSYKTTKGDIPYTMDDLKWLHRNTISSATGQRSAYYKNAPKIVQEQFDSWEGGWTSPHNLIDAAKLAASTARYGKAGLYKKSFDVEISRTASFIRHLMECCRTRKESERQLKKLLSAAPGG